MAIKNTKNQALLKECHAVLSRSYPKLHIVKVEPQIVIRGVFPVRLENEEIDQFLIEIVLPPDYSTGDTPLVKELGGRIPHEIKHHVFEGGYLCLFVLDEQWKYWNAEKGIAGFFAEPLNDYFLSQLYFERYGIYPFGERGHGVKGIIEYYMEELETADMTIIYGCVQYLSAEGVKGHWDCYCGSGLRLRNCHGEKFHNLRSKISVGRARISVQAIHNARAEMANFYAAQRRALLQRLSHN